LSFWEVLSDLRQTEEGSAAANPPPSSVIPQFDSDAEKPSFLLFH
jgi:hypothetical protein